MNRLSVRLFLSDSENPYQILQGAQARETAARLDVDICVESAEGDFSNQVRQIFRATRPPEAPQAVLVHPVQETALKSLSETTVALGIGWVYLNRSAGNLGELRRASARVPCSLVSPDQREIGRVQARQLRRMFPQGAQILYVQGRVTTSSAEARAAGLREGLREPGSRIEIASTLDGNWTARDAETSMARWLQRMGPSSLRIDAVACQSDFMAEGVLAALAASALDAPTLAALPVLGCDGLPDAGRRAVDEGRLACTVTVPLTAARALEAVAAFFRHGTAMPEERLLPPRGYPEDGVRARSERVPHHTSTRPHVPGLV